MGIKTVTHTPYTPDLASCDFSLFLKLNGCRYETIEEMKEAVTKVIDTLTQEDFDGAFQKFFERYKCIAVGGDYFEADLSLMCVLSIKVSIRKNSSYAPRIYMRVCMFVSSIFVGKRYQVTDNVVLMLSVLYLSDLIQVFLLKTRIYFGEIQCYYYYL